MQLFNTLTRSNERVIPIHNNSIGLYACGFTVYDYTHLGHLRKYSMDDVLVRMLRHEGFEVHFVQNITDVGHLASDEDTGEDKLEKGAKKYGKTVWEIAKEFESYFWKSMDAMGNLRPDVSCRATDHIKEQLELVLELEKKGHTYVIEGDGVYFDTSTFPEYGKMARLNLEQQKEGARVDQVAGKRNPSDFALWKFERPGENRQMVWKSPWSDRSFPGWHVECSAMAMKYLGEQFEIHTGGIDHIQVHHTNEIAQSEAATLKHPFVKIWVHHNHLRINNEKMSKSLGNFFTIDDVIKKGFSPMALRMLFLTSHYRSEMNFTWENLEGSQKSYDKLVAFYAALSGDQSQRGDQTSDQALSLQTSFFDALRNDLATPQAMSVLWEVLKSDLSNHEKKRLLDDFDRVLGLKIAQSAAQSTKELESKDKEQVPPEISELLEKRKMARDNKDWSVSDEIRNRLEQKGYIVHDLPDGTQKLDRI